LQLLIQGPDMLIFLNNWRSTTHNWTAVAIGM